MEAERQGTEHGLRLHPRDRRANRDPANPCLVHQVARIVLARSCISLNVRVWGASEHSQKSTTGWRSMNKRWGPNSSRSALQSPSTAGHVIANSSIDQPKEPIELTPSKLLSCLIHHANHSFVKHKLQISTRHPSTVLKLALAQNTQGNYSLYRKLLLCSFR